MHLNIKKLLAAISATAIAVTALAGSVSTVYAVDKYPTSGKIGDKAGWFINSDNVLVIHGEGEMTCPPEGWIWNATVCNYTNEINEVVIENGITTAGQMAFYYLYNLSKITLPPSLTKLNSGWLDPNPEHYKNLKDIYLYSSNISDFSGIYTSHSWYDSEIIWHVNKNSTTEQALKNDLHLTDENIKYITDDDIMPNVQNRDPIKMEPLTDTLGPSGLNSKWQYNTSNNTLTFSGKGTISIADDYKKYAQTTEHIVIGEGITKIDANSGQVRESGFIVSQAFYGFTAVKDVKLPDTLKEIGEASFYQTHVTKIDLPSSLEIIGRYAFKYSDLEEISFPENLNLKEIGEGAFSFSKIKSIKLNEGMTIGGSAFNKCESLKEVIIPKNVAFGRTAGGGQGMARDHGTFANCTGLETITFEDGSVLVDSWNKVQTENGIGENFCLGCTSLKTVIIKGNINCIMAQAFRNCSKLNDIYFYNKGLNTITAKESGPLISRTDSIDLSNNPTFHIYKGSATETTLRNAGYLTNATDTTKANYVYLVPDDSKNDLDKIIKKAESINTGKCSKDLADSLKKAIDEAKPVLEKAKTDPNTSLEEVTKAIESLNNAINNIPADYTSVDKAIANVPKELGKYTDSSVNALNEVLKSVDRTKNITEQDIVDGYAKVINDAIAGLKLKPIQHNNANVNLETKKNAEKIMNQAKITSLKVKSNGKRKITVKWKKVNKAEGYQVQVSKKKKFKGKNIIFNKKIKNKKLVIKKGKIKSKKVYFVRVRAYKTYQDENGVTKYAYSEWNKKTRKVKVK